MRPSTPLPLSLSTPTSLPSRTFSRNNCFNCLNSVTVSQSHRLSHRVTMVSALLILSSTAAFLLRPTLAFPSGAPPEACESLSPERGHGVPSMPVQYAPFTVIAYGSQYRAGDKVPGQSACTCVPGNRWRLTLNPLLHVCVFDLMH